MLSGKEALRISGFGRFGNSLRQILNALYIRERLEVKTLYIPKLWYIQNNLPFISIVDEEECSLEKNNDIFTHDFFHISKLDLPFSRKFNYSEIYKKHKDIFVFKKECDYKIMDTDLVIHFRSGDIFENNIHKGYGQPPFAFYRKLIEEKSWNIVYCVFENMSNPVIGKVTDYLSTNKIEYRCICSDLEGDISFLVNAVNLVVSPGTFTWAISIISENIKNIYYFHSLSDYDIYPKHLTYIGLFDKSQLYINSIMNNNWINSPEQIQMMIEYDINNISYNK